MSFKFVLCWSWLLLIIGMLALRTEAHTDQEQPAFVDILPQRTFLVVRITGSANDLNDAVTSGGHENQAASSGAMDAANLDTRAEVNSYLNHHMLLTQSGQRLEGSLQALTTYPNTFDDSKDDFKAVYRYERDPALANKPLQVTSILFNFLGKSQTVVSLQGVERTLGAGQETKFDGALTLPDLSRNFYAWFNRGLVRLTGSIELVSFFVALLCAATSLRAHSLLAAVLGFTLAQSVGLAISLISKSQLSPHAISIGIACSIVVMGLYAWVLAQRVGQSSSNTTNSSLLTRWLIPLATSFGVVYGLPLGPRFSEQGLPQEGLPWCMAGFTVGALLTQLAVSGLGFLLLKRLRAKYEHESQYGGISWPRLLQWTSGSVGGIGAFWLLERLLG